MFGGSLDAYVLSNVDWGDCLDDILGICTREKLSTFVQSLLLYDRLGIVIENDRRDDRNQ